MLTNFNKIVLTIATILLSISFILLGISLTKSLYEDVFPPIVSDCPDYWDVSYNSNDDVACKNTSTINSGNGTVACGSIDGYPVDLFSSSGTNKYDVICEKYKWARKCGIVWDGITNNNKACDFARL